MRTFTEYLMEAGKRPNVNFSDRTYNNAIEWVKIDKLLKYQGNRIGKTDVNELAQDIEKNGLDAPLSIVLSLEKKMAVLSEGNHRMMAMKHAGYKEAPVFTMVVGWKEMIPGTGVKVKVKAGVQKDDWLKLSDAIERI